MLTLFNFLFIQRKRKPTISAAAERAEKLRAKRRKLNSQTPAPVVDLTSNDIPCDHEDDKVNGFWKQVGEVKLGEADRYVVQYIYGHHVTQLVHMLTFCRKILESSSKWLTDNIINATQELLRRKYPMLGLQNTLLSYTLAFDVMTEEFVQVLHSGGNHWLAVSTIGCPPSTVKVYDSLYSELPTQTKEQICALLVSQEPVIDLIYVTVQSQQNGCDCGLFALAFATALCSGQNPQCLLFKKSVMRAHLLKCLEDEDIKPFPCKTVNRAQQRNKTGKIEIFYKCRTQEAGRMVSCSGCREWYHEECMPIPKQVWRQNSKYEWYCDKCRV